MKITIVGAGRVGVHLAKYFADEQQDVFVVDRDPSHLMVLESDFNLRTFAGDPTEFQVLREAGADKADIFVAVTADTSENIVACAMAKSLGAKKTIARVDKYSYIHSANEEVVGKMGVDHVVFPDYLASQAVIESLEHPWSKAWTEFENGSIILSAIEISEHSPIVNTRIKELAQDSNIMHISALRRNHQTIIPGGEDIILPGDTLYITALPSSVDFVNKATGTERFGIKRVVIMGGSMVSQLTAQFTGKKFSYSIIEKNRERCRELMRDCPDCEIICGDASEQDVLEEAGINRCDAFIALTDNTESNILSCLTAEDVGVKKVIAEVEKEQLMPKAEGFNIGTIINKPIITANAIFQIILDSRVDSSKCFILPDAEVGRLQVKKDSFLTKDTVMNLPLPKELTFAGIVREGKGEMVTGSTRFLPGDTVIVFCLAGSLRKVERLFGK